MANSSTANLFASLEEYALKGDFKQAEELLIKNRDQFNQELYHYDLGTLRLKQGDQVVARFHLQKAIKDGLLYPDAFNNLEIANNQLHIQDLATTRINPLEGFLDKAIDLPDECFLCLSLCLVCCSLFLFWRNNIRKLSILFVSLILSATPYVVSEIIEQKLNPAISLKEVELREGPSNIFTPNKKVAQGVKILIDKIDGEWFHICYPTIYEGWAQRDTLGIY